MNKIMIIAAHPDDDVLGCGGVMSKYNQEYIFRVVFIAEGSTCRFSEIHESNEIQVDAINERKSSAIESLRFLGIEDIMFYNLPCGRLDAVPIIEINKIIESEIDDFKPNIVLVHSPLDNNNDHRIINRSLMMAARPGVFDHLNNVVEYEVLSSTEWNFSSSFLPNIFIEISEVDLNNKWAALSCYQSEISDFPHPRSLEGVKALARYRGIQCGHKLTEGYRLVWGRGM